MLVRHPSGGEVVGALLIPPGAEAVFLAEAVLAALIGDDRRGQRLHPLRYTGLSHSSGTGVFVTIPLAASTSIG